MIVFLLALLVTADLWLAPGTVLEDQQILITASHVTVGMGGIPNPPVLRDDE